MKNLLFLASLLVSATAFPYAKQHGDLCDWRGHTETCDQSKGLSCSYSTGACACWDARRHFSSKAQRCVGKAGEECAFFETERLCTENAFCSEDRSFSPIPICVCLKGYFRSDNGSCVKYSNLGEYCQPFPSRQACETESGLKCIDYVCKCEHGQIYDPIKKMCIAKAGQPCQTRLKNCVQNSDCNEKMWAFDYEMGETKTIGYRCGCKPGFKITENGLCAVDYGGFCNKTSDCFLGENLSCLDGMCQCHPLSQIYDKSARRCLNLVGARCQGKNKTGISDLKSEQEGSFSSSESADCIPNASCVSSAQGNFICMCGNGSSETVMKTCLQDYGQPCETKKDESQMTGLQGMKCNVFEGLICHSDLGKCLCADPSLVYDKDAKACVSDLGNDCGGNVRLNMLNLEEDLKKMIVINCITNSTCLEKNINGKVKSICVPKGGFGTSGSSLSKIMLTNANVINDKE